MHDFYIFSPLKLHECDICRKQFASAEHLKIHRLKIHEVKLYKKKENGNSYDEVQQETLIELHKCKICGKQFSSAEYLKNHRNCHNNNNARPPGPALNIKPLLPIKPNFSPNFLPKISILPTQPLKIEELYPIIQTRCNICLMKFSSEEFLKIHQEKNCQQGQLFKMTGLKPNNILLANNTPTKKPIALSIHEPPTPSPTPYPVMETIFHVCGQCGKTPLIS